ncbi:UNVERIFIED_CONTAM: hypothetical protein Sangu_0396900 [Sesamum angustifolium]|uniref:Uncharacterized protein n=1 Tax=Sesamum angustifolium TaxID=2727405 RepID=A0AAW2QSY3_9LAMI
MKPSAQCRDLKLSFLPEQPLLTVSFLDNDAQIETSVRVPVPRVLVDPESPLQVRAFDDHIEVKLVLLLPVDHPLVSDFDSVLSSEENKDELLPLSIDSDLKKLSSMKEVHFYCRNCSSKLTKGLRCFEEMPSVNWRDVADNWFGNCCCSFGGNDILGCQFSDVRIRQNYESDEQSLRDKCSSKDSQDEINWEPLQMYEKSGANGELLETQKVFLDGYLGNGFMVRSSGLSRDIRWIEFLCPGCSCLVGAYPCFGDNVPIDGGVRLFKCYISTCLPSSGADVFRDASISPPNRNYTLERLFASQLLESAEDELSFRTVVRDMQTKSPVLQIILLNPNSWGCSGSLHPAEPATKLVMNPNIKVLFSAPSHGEEFDSRYAISSDAFSFWGGMGVQNYAFKFCWFLR